MNNEEKILTLLESLTSEVKDMKTDMSDMKTDIKNIKTDMEDVKLRLTNVELGLTNVELRLTNVELRLTNVELRLTDVELTIENKTNKHIQILAEGHKGLVDRLWHLPDEVEEVKETVSILKFFQVVDNQKKSNNVMAQA